MPWLRGASTRCPRAIWARMIRCLLPCRRLCAPSFWPSAGRHPPCAQSCQRGHYFHREIKPSATLSALKVRSTNPASVLSLPYGLGVINKKHIYEIDVFLADEWKSLLSRQIPVSVGNQVATAVVSSLLALCEAANPPTPEALPAFALSMKGKAESDTAHFQRRPSRAYLLPRESLWQPSSEPLSARWSAWFGSVNLGSSSWLTTLAATMGPCCSAR